MRPRISREDERAEYDGIEDCVRKIRHFLAHFGEARAIAERARARVVRDHGYRQPRRPAAGLGAPWLDDASKAGSSARILILRRDNIGDLVCTTPLIAALRAQLPGAWLGALVTSYNAEVLAGNPALDEVFVYEKLKHRTGSLLSHLRSRLGQWSRMREHRIDCVLVPANSPRTLKLARSLKPGRVLAAPVTVPARQHEVERIYELGRALGLRGKPGPLQLRPDARKRAELEARLGTGSVRCGAYQRAPAGAALAAGALRCTCRALGEGDARDPALGAGRARQSGPSRRRCRGGRGAAHGGESCRGPGTDRGPREC